MSTQNNKRKLDDAYRPTFDPGLDMMTEVFSHVQCVRTRHSLARVSKLWRKASKTAAAYPRNFDFDAFPRMYFLKRNPLIIRLLDNDEALSLPYERVVELLGEAAKNVCYFAAMRGSVRLLKWAREYNLDWSTHATHAAAVNGHLPALKYLHENGCPWNSNTCWLAVYEKRWDCLKYAVDNKCDEWERFAKGYAKHLR